MTEEKVRFASGALSLEGRLSIVEGAACGAVVCHPHPQYGGDMDNSVVVAATEALGRAGLAALRFNFRGVGASDGRYSGSEEIADARAAVACLRDRLPSAAIALGGYSFGAMVALLAGHDDARVERLFAIAPPIAMFDVSAIARSTKPKLFIAGDRDPYCPYSPLEETTGRLSGANSLMRLSGADHFLFGFEERVGEEVSRFVGG